MRTRTTFVAVALLVAVAAVPVAGLAATDGIVADQHGNSTTDANASVAPGERLSGVVGIQEAELEGEVDERAFGLEVARAATNESKADVVAEQFENVEQRLADLEERKQALEQARANGSMSEGEYRAEVAELATRTQTAKELANSSENASQGLPADLLESKGINASAIQTLKDRASQLTGPEVAEIARSIAGKAAPVDAGPEERPGQGGESGQGGPPEERGQGDSAENGQDGGEADTPTGTPTDGTDQGEQDGTDSPTDTPAPDDGGDGSDRGGDGGAGGGDGGDGGGDGGAGGY